MNRFLVALALSRAGSCTSRDRAREPPPRYRNPDLSAVERAGDLVHRMTVAEKISQTMTAAPAIPRLGVPAYEWWSEALHGVARAGRATVFPQAIALAATFDDPLVKRVATVISDEGRAKFNQAQARGERGRYHGLTFFSPNINIFRDPRWGRGHETFGEDPVLTARMGVAFITGMQGDNPHYWKTIATAKHFAVHSGPEVDRHTFDARVSAHDLADTYLPHFEAAVRNGRVASVMAAYNAVDGEACAASPTLLEDTLRKRWGFLGYVVGDCGAIDDIWKHHKMAAGAGGGGGRGAARRHRPRLRLGVQEPGCGAGARPDHGGGPGSRAGAPVRGALPAGPVRSAGRACPGRGSGPRRSNRPPTWCWRGRPRRARSSCSRTAPACCRSGHRSDTWRSSVPWRTTCPSFSRTITASRRIR